MKVKKYMENGEGSVTIILIDGEETISFYNSNIYNNGEWCLYNYRKKANDENASSFEIIANPTSEQICYLTKDYSRAIDLGMDDIVKADCIRIMDGKLHINYYVNPKLLGIYNLSDYLKNQELTYFNIHGKNIDFDIDDSTKAIIDFLKYRDKYSKILEEAIKERAILFDEAKKKLIKHIDINLEENR